MADLQLNKWIAAIISAVVIVLQVWNGVQESNILKLEQSDTEKLTQIISILAKSQSTPAPSPTQPLNQ